MYSVKDNARALGCPIRIFPDQCLFSAPRNFSQSITSFFASHCQGIHQMPFLSWFSLCVCGILSKPHTVCKLLLLTNFRVLLNSFFFARTRMCLTLQILAKDLLYTINLFIVYNRYTSYSLFLNNIPYIFARISFHSFSPLRSTPSPLGGGERVRTDDP